jgi:putative NAD(P)-binding protein
VHLHAVYIGVASINFCAVFYFKRYSPVSWCFGAGDSRASINCFQILPFRFFFGRAYDDKDVQERLIKNCALDWTIARPGVLTNGSRT